MTRGSPEPRMSNLELPTLWGHNEYVRWVFIETTVSGHLAEGQELRNKPSEMQKLKEILATTFKASEGPSTSSSWRLRQSATQDEWQESKA
ncbi:hypothetical protein QQF64_020045 [Cirrhinus molitorella]|uniref:Uncharacterized protein n=1 Tax=Cirrhinus molitorella TaxID=172907 RepID=A0ABR3LKH7_9TELE